VSYLTGPSFADLLIKDDIGHINFDLPAVASLDNANANSLGATLTFGGHFGGMNGRRLVWEPIASLSYVRTTIDDLTWPRMNFAWRDGSSFRGTLGLSLSGDLVGNQGQTTWQPFIFGGIGDEFNGDNQLTLTSGGNSLVLADNPLGTFGIVSLGLNVFGNNGWSGFIRGDGTFGDNYTSGAIRIGLRYTFGAAPPPPPPKK